MQDDDLIRMAKQIAGFFTAYGEEEAVAGVETHLKSFWAPAMRARLVEIAAETPERLDPIVRRATERLRP